jgi:hypothetical protein
MNYKEAFSNVENSDVFKEWKKAHSNAYLAHLFANITPQLTLSDWQVGYYDKKRDKMTSFFVGAVVEKKPEAEVFKKNDAVERLMLDLVSVDQDTALETLKKVQKEKYPQHLLAKGFCILQHLDCVVWNVTLLTKTFAALNVKIDAVSGEVIDDSVSTFFDMKAK